MFNLSCLRSYYSLNVPQCLSYLFKLINCMRINCNFYYDIVRNKWLNDYCPPRLLPAALPLRAGLVLAPRLFTAGARLPGAPPEAEPGRCQTLAHPQRGELLFVYKKLQFFSNPRFFLSIWNFFLSLAVQEACAFLILEKRNI